MPKNVFLPSWALNVAGGPPIAFVRGLRAHPGGPTVSVVTLSGGPVSGRASVQMPGSILGRLHKRWGPSSFGC